MCVPHFHYRMVLRYAHFFISTLPPLPEETILFALRLLLLVFRRRYLHDCRKLVTERIDIRIFQQLCRLAYREPLPDPAGSHFDALLNPVLSRRNAVGFGKLSAKGMVCHTVFLCDLCQRQRLVFLQKTPSRFQRNHIPFLLEALNADAYYSTSVTYYDVLLAGKSMRDPDSVEMLNIIRSSRTMDAELVYNFIGLSSIYENMQNKKSFDILASSIASKQQQAEKAIADLIEQYK